MEPLYTERCCIEPLDISHVSGAVGLFTDPVVRAFLGGPIPADFAEKRLERWAQSGDPYFIVKRTEDGAILGLVDIAPHHEPGAMELSYLFFPEYWGGGYAFESISRILEHCKTGLHLTRVVSETQKKNLRSCRLLEKLGYTLIQEVVRFGAEQCIYEKVL